MKKLNKLIGLSLSDFENMIKPSGKNEDPQIYVRSAALIPTSKVGDEMALTSIFLSSIRLIKEFRDVVFKEIKFPRSGKNYFYTEVSFPQIFDGRFDGMIINVSSGKIKDVAFFEMKNGKNNLDKSQIDKYIKFLKSGLKVNKLVTISNQFVSDVNETPIEQLRVPPSFNLCHLSWTYLLTIAHILLFDNDDNIEDVDQIEIMKEVVRYFENDKSGILNHSSMSESWKEISDKLFRNEKLLKSDKKVREAVNSWHQKERDLALLLSRNLGADIKSSKRAKKDLDNAIDKLLKKHILLGSILIKDAISKISIKLDFIRRSVTLSVALIPPSDKTNNGKVSFLFKQFEKCQKKEGQLYDNISEDLLIEPDFKFLKNQPNYSLKVFRNENFKAHNDIQRFTIHYTRNFKGSFSSRNKFVSEIDQMTLMFYEAVVQHLSNWKKPPPKIDNFID